MKTKRKMQVDGRYRISLSLKPDEMHAVEEAAGSQGAARWAKWAVLKMARKVGEVTA